MTFSARLRPATPEVKASIKLQQAGPWLEEVRLRAPADRYLEFTGEGDIRRDGDRLIWRPPAAGGSLTYTVRLEHRRSRSGYDALVTEDWALFRVDDLFPPAAISQADGAASVSELKLSTPRGWTTVTPFESSKDGGWLIDNPERKFDRPTGWVATGRLGVRRDTIDGIKVAVASPAGSEAERVSMLALLRWTLPNLTGRLPVQTKRLLVVSAGDPMWRGGLSAPGSLFIHAERPLLSENGTSTLVHEMIHVLVPVPAASDHDWIDEGLAEYLTLRVLRDSGGISGRRMRDAVKRFRERGGKVDDLTGSYSSGNRTALAVAIFSDLDTEMRKASDGKITIYTLTERLMADTGPVDLQRLRALAQELTGLPEIDSLAASRLPGLE